MAIPDLFEEKITDAKVVAELKAKEVEFSNQNFGDYPAGTLVKISQNNPTTRDYKNGEGKNLTESVSVYFSEYGPLKISEIYDPSGKHIVSEYEGKGPEGNFIVESIDHNQYANLVYAKTLNEDSVDVVDGVYELAYKDNARLSDEPVVNPLFGFVKVENVVDLTNNVEQGQ